MSESTIDRVVKVAAEVFDIGPSVVTKDSSPDSIEEWDSMAHVRLIVALEKEFEITISPDDAVDFETVGMISAWVDLKVK